MAGEELVVSAPEHAVRTERLITPKDVKIDFEGIEIGIAHFLNSIAPNDMGLGFLTPLHDAESIAS